MNTELQGLARRLDECRRRGNKMTLGHVLESAAILRRAKELAKRNFGTWLREEAHMVRLTALRHMAVEDFVGRNVSSTKQIASLSIAKVYELSTLDPGIARRILLGLDRFSLPLDQLSDVQFRREFRERFPQPSKRRTRQHSFMEVYSAIVRLKRAFLRGGRHASRMTPGQRERIVRELRGVIQAARGWQIVA